jgi:hypothetical protein
MYYSLVAYCTTLTVQTSHYQSSREEILAVRGRVKPYYFLDVPTFATSHLPRDPSGQRRNYVGEKWPMNFAQNARLPRSIQVSFTAVNLRHGTDGFTSPPKEGALRIFSPEKIRRLRPGLNPPPRNHLWDNVEKHCRAGHTADDNIIWRTRTACWITKAKTHTQNMQYLSPFYSNNGYANAPQCNVIHTLPVLLYHSFDLSWPVLVNLDKTMKLTGWFSPTVYLWSRSLSDQSSCLFFFRS